MTMEGGATECALLPPDPILDQHARDRVLARQAQHVVLRRVEQLLAREPARGLELLGVEVRCGRRRRWRRSRASATPGTARAARRNSARRARSRPTSSFTSRRTESSSRSPSSTNPASTECMPGAQLAWRASRTLSPYSTRMMTAGSMRGKNIASQAGVAAAALMPRLFARRSANRICRRRRDARANRPCRAPAPTARRRAAAAAGRRCAGRRRGRVASRTLPAGADRSMAICATSASQPSSTTERARSIKSAAAARFRVRSAL